MQNSKIYSVLKHFNKYEQNRLRKYILSPYFNKNEALIRLFELLIEHINTNTEEDLKKEDIWKLLNQKPIYDDVRFRKLLSELLKLVESFLAQQIFEANPLRQATYLIEAVGNNQMEKLYNTSKNTAIRLSKQQYYKPANYYFYQYQIEKNFYQLARHQFKRIDRKNVEEIANNLDCFYLAEKLKYYCSVLSQQYVVSHEYELLFIDEIVNHINKYSYEDIPPIAVYFQIYLTLIETDNEEHYFKLKELLTKHGLVFPLQEAQEIYEHALNYCVRRINKGQPKFLEEYFYVYKDLLEKEIIYRDGELAPLHFKNIIVAALRLGKYDWTEKFIHQYNYRLPETFRENAVTFNLARLYWYKKDYDRVIEMLRTVEYEDVTYNLTSKAILLLTYYETDEMEALYSLMESFRAYLNRHKRIPLQRRKNYLDLIRFVKKLTNILPGDSKSLDKLKLEIENNKIVAADKNWLKEKIAELE